VRRHFFCSANLRLWSRSGCFPGIQTAPVPLELFTTTLNESVHEFLFAAPSMLAWVRLALTKQDGSTTWLTLFDFSSTRGGPNNAMLNVTDLCDGYGALICRVQRVS